MFDWMASHPSVRTDSARGREGSADDGELVERVRAGDRAAFEALFHAYAVNLRGFAYSMVQSRAVAEELVQDVFFRLWVRRQEWAPGSVAAYLYRATRNAAFGYERHAAVETRWAIRAAREAGPDAGIVGHAGEERLAVPDRVAALERALSGLSSDRRRVVLLRWKHGLSYAEIAHVVGSTPKAVEVQLYRALTALRRALAGIGRGVG